MRLIVILFCLVSWSSIYGQKNKKKDDKLRSCAGVTMVSYGFMMGDSLIKCKDCHWDDCANVIGIKGDTIYKHNGIVAENFMPLYLTLDTVLLPQRFAAYLFTRNKIRHLQFLHCNDVFHRFGFTSLEGLCLIDLKDTTIESGRLYDRIQRQYPDSVVAPTRIRIGGFQNSLVTILKYPVSEDIKIVYLEKYKLYSFVPW